MAKIWHAIRQGWAGSEDTHSLRTHTRTHCLAPRDDYKNVQFCNTYFPFGNKPKKKKRKTARKLQKKKWKREVSEKFAGRK